MRKLLIICAACLQIVMLAFMGGQREYVLRTGKIIYLRTVPFDPRDLFRGDYVRLNYEISSINKKYFKDGLTKTSKYENGWFPRGMPVYTVLQVNDNGLANVAYVSDKKPHKGDLFIRGRTGYNHNGFSCINVLYGIEAYFVEQGKGKELESRMFDNQRSAIDMEVALGNNGIAVLKGYRRGPLSIKTESFERKEGFLKSCKLVLTNISDKPVAIVDLPDYRSLKLEMGNSFLSRKAVWTKDDTNAPKPANRNVHVLQPNQNYEFAVDFNNPRWFVFDSEKGTEEMSLEQAGRFMSLFSLVYESPDAEQCKDLKDAGLIWHGKLTSGMLDNFKEDIPSMSQRRN